MGWEKRGNGYYYYRKTREGGRIRSVYHGRGEVAKFLSTTDEYVREREASDWRRDNERQAESARELDEIDALLDGYSRRAAEVLSAALLAAGYHRHKRQWRKRRTRPDAERAD